MGMFINIRRCAVLYLHETNGSWVEAPYLDAYGETDVMLKSALPPHHSRETFLLTAGQTKPAAVFEPEAL